MWSERVGKGGISASPVLANGLIYATFENGSTTVFKATPERFEKVAENQLGTSSFATQVMLGDKIYARIATSRLGKRSEFLVCIGEK